MNDIEVSSIDLVEGGNVFKQGHYLTLGYVPRDENGETVDLSGKTLNVALWGRKGIVFEAAATYSAGVIRFTLDKTVPAAEDYTVEFTATSSTDAKYRKKFPANSNAARIAIKQSADDLGAVGISVFTIDKFEKKQKELQDAYHLSVDSKVETLEADFEQAVGALTVDSEVVLARGEATTLRARLDAEKAATAGQLAETGSKVAVLNDFTEYGQLKMPSDFPVVLPFDLYRDLDGLIKHNFDFKGLTSGFPTVYINESIGVDSLDGTTPETPVKSLTKALTYANAMPESTVNICFTEKWVQYNLTAPAVNDQVFTLTKNINLISSQPEGSIIYSGNEPNVYTWAEAGSGAYSTVRSATTHVADYKFKSFRGFPRLYKKVATLAECQATPGTWFGNTTTYVHRLDGSKPDTDVCVMLPYNNDITFNLNGFRLFIDQVSIWQAKNTSNFSVYRIFGTGESTFIARKASAAFGNTNGWGLSGIKRAYLFECEAFSTGSDGFNYHGGVNDFAFEYYCYSHDNGQVVNGTSNATTAHDGMTMLRVGSIGHDSKGPVCADVNGCFSVLIECTMYNSLRSAGAPKAAFYFDNSLATKQGKAYLINCGGGGKDTFTVNTDANFDLNVKKLKGNNIPSGLTVTTIS